MTQGEMASAHSRFAFHLMIAAFVIVTSFAYGISVGVRRQFAQASFSPLPMSSFVGIEGQIPELDLPAGVNPISLGDRIEINGKPSDVVMFRSGRSAEALINEQVRTWKRRGWVAAGHAGQKRGVAFAIDRATGRRYSMTLWSVPPSLRQAASAGAPIEGIIAASSDVDLRPSSPDLGEGRVPGVPLMHGGKGGAVMGSVGIGGQSYSGVYTNPGTVEENLMFYRATFLGEGWTNANFMPADVSERGVGSLRMVKGSEEIVLLLAPLNGERGSKTVVNIARGPNLSRY